MSNSALIDKSIRQIIDSNVAKATAIAALPVPLVDSIGVMFIQYQMIEKIATHHGKSINNQQLTIIIVAISALLTKLITGSLNAANKKIKLNKIFGRAMISAAMVGLFTSAIGELFHLHFKNGGEVGDLGLDAVIKYAQLQIASEKMSVENLGGALIQNVLKQIN